MRVVRFGTPAWRRYLDGLSRSRGRRPALEKTVNTILRQVRRDGDRALVRLTRRYDGVSLDPSRIRAHPREIRASARRADPRVVGALRRLARGIERFHKQQLDRGFRLRLPGGGHLEERVGPLDSVGLYVPGGAGAYPSSVLMNALPAKVAGVPELIMVVPTPGGELNELVLAAAYLCGVSQVFAVGGAQAVAALAYGTETIPWVDKVVGPGNIYVATAKRAVFGQVGIDMVAGPSEILVICDGGTDPDWVAMDLFSQAEHDEDAQSILVCPDAAFIDQVKISIERLLPTMERASIIAKALRERGALILCRDLDEACEVANTIAPEHLELSVEKPLEMVGKIRHAGAIFMGRHTSEPLGDYCAGPNHVLPTSRTARFSSPLGVYDFQKRSSLIMVSERGSDTLGRTASVLARGEGLTAHARSAEYRFKK